MELMESIKGRRSVRAFSGRKVSRDDVTTVINAGIAAPSKGNCQIWEFVAVFGEKKKEMDERMLALVRTDLIPSMSVGEAAATAENAALAKADGRHRQYEREISGRLSPASPPFRQFIVEGTFTFFSAPVAILVFVDEVFAKDLPHILSVGAAVENMLLTATALGLGSCWIGGVWRYTPVLRTLLGIPESKKLLSSVALGYPDERASINTYKAGRDGMEEFVRWAGTAD